jgi:hypothetical protein
MTQDKIDALQILLRAVSILETWSYPPHETLIELRSSIKTLVDSIAKDGEPPKTEELNAVTSETGTAAKPASIVPNASAPDCLVSPDRETRPVSNKSQPETPGIETENSNQ